MPRANDWLGISRDFLPRHCHHVHCRCSFWILEALYDGFFHPNLVASSKSPPSAITLGFSFWSKIWIPTNKNVMLAGGFWGMMGPCMRYSNYRVRGVISKLLSTSRCKALRKTCRTNSSKKISSPSIASQTPNQATFTRDTLAR